MLTDARPIWMCLICSALITASGCSRAWWRQQADRDVAEMVAEKNGYFDLGEIQPAADSRLADGYDLDASPLPPDDPTSHRLMHEVDGKRGHDWHRNGEAPSVDLQRWMQTLPSDQNGNVVLNMADAVRIGRKHSREYQGELEDLYLSALDVTFQRFRFDTQFFLGNKTQQTFDGRFRSGSNDSSTLATTTNAEMRKLTATGGDLVVGLANSLVWQFSGNGSDTLGSVFDFSLVQPLLRFGGRVRVLEQLTQSERTLLANVRQMEQYRQGFYVQVVAGRNSGPGPVRRGEVGQQGLGLIAGLPSGRSGAAPVGGYIGLLQEQQQIRNRTANLTGLRESYVSLEAFFQFGLLQTRLQVDQARQAYLNALSNLMTTQAGYASRLDTFKLSLGLPPSVPLDVKDPLIDKFNLLDPLLVELQEDVNNTLLKLSSATIPPEQIGFAERRQELLQLRSRIDSQFERAAQDYAELKKVLPDRLARLQRLKQRVPELKLDVDMRVFEPSELMGRIQQMEGRLPLLRDRIDQRLKGIASLSEEAFQQKPAERLRELIEYTGDLGGDLDDLKYFQSSARLETTDLMPLQLGEAQALEIARQHRLDWMNARANLVDSWRKIEFDANALESDLNLVISGDIGTKEDNIAEFRKENGRLRFGVEFDSPVTRLAERNQYRDTLIEYQRARRDYMLFEDQVSQSLRNTLRVVDLSQINFEIRRSAVRIAISQVLGARLKFFEPPKPGVPRQISPTAARDQVSALNDLLDAQNDFLNAWVSYEVLRMLLDFELGTMQLTPEGMWIDRGAPVPEAVPAPEAVPPLVPAPAPPKAPAAQAAATRTTGWHATTSSKR